MNGTTISEGQFVLLKDEDIPNSADVVFIVEAKNCNRNVRNNKKIDDLVNNIENELLKLNINNNRYWINYNS